MILMNLHTFLRFVSVMFTKNYTQHSIYTTLHCNHTNVIIFTTNCIFAFYIYITLHCNHANMIIFTKTAYNIPYILHYTVFMEMWSFSRQTSYVWGNSVAVYIDSGLLRNDDFDEFAHVFDIWQKTNFRVSYIPRCTVIMHIWYF